MQISDLNIYQLAYFVIFTAVIGLCIGSFLNVVILRAFWKEPIVLPPSKCPKCKTKLKWYDNIPLLSFLMLGGKCRYCKEPISLQYPIVEAICSILFICSFLKFGFSLNTIFVWIFVSLFIVLAVSDIKEKVIFDYHAYILAGVGLIYNFFNVGHKHLGTFDFSLLNHQFKINNSFFDAILACFVCILIMEILARCGKLFFHKRAFGEGDSYIAGAIGMIFGLKMSLYALAIGFFIQAVLILPFFIVKLFQTKQFKLIVWFACFIVSAIFTKLISNTVSTLYLVLVVALSVFGLLIVKDLFKSLRNQETPTTIPFGPAMLFGALIVLFFANYIRF